MTIDSTYLGMEVIPAESFLEKTRYKITCRCLRCGRTYWKLVDVIPKNDPPCPRKKCKEAALREEVMKEMANSEAMLESGQGPTVIGANPRVRAVDKTAEIVMADYRMTNIRDNVREGENMVTTLPQAQQEKVDNYFKAQPLRNRGFSSQQVNALKQKAISGAFANAAVRPNQVMPEGKPPVRLVGQPYRG